MMWPKTYKVLTEAVENGVRYGLIRRCVEKRDLIQFKGTTEEQAVVEISDSVINSICEWFEFDFDSEDTNDQP